MQAIVIDESSFRPTSLESIVHHFICKLCNSVIVEGRQCHNKNCCMLFCKGCVDSKRPWGCPICQTRSEPVDMHRRLKDFVQLLKFVCPGCSESLMYQQMLEHIKTCEEAKNAIKEGRTQKAGSNQVEEANMNRRITMIDKFKDASHNTPNNFAQGSGQIMIDNQFPQELFIFQKDSRTISIFNIPQKTLQHKIVDFRGNFPHNFQMIQIGNLNPRVYMIGGGDYKSLPETMYQCKELV